MYSKDTLISELVKDIHSGKLQLPDFQRGWVWDDNRIKALLASISNLYPVGAAMFLANGNDSVQFKYRTIEGCPDNANQTVPDWLILDGQQRLTSIYSSLFSENPVNTRTDKGAEIKRFYYFDIEKCLSTTTDRVEAIISVDENKQIKGFGRDKIVLDLSDKNSEFEKKLIPANILLDSGKYNKWQMDCGRFYKFDEKIMNELNDFFTKIQTPMSTYAIPVINLGKDTPKEAVCQVFENVNTGGVSLTVFELVTAMFAMGNFELRKDWEEIKEKHFTGDILSYVESTDFLQAMTLLTTYKANKKSGFAVGCKRKNILDLKLADYKANKEALINGFIEAEKFLEAERIFSSNDLPYSSQLIPLSVLCTLLQEAKLLNITSNKDKLKQWFWCGVFGELYGGTLETRYVNDVVGVMEWINGGNIIPKTIQDSFFSPLRLLTLQTRSSAAYKGIMSLIMKNDSKDFIGGSSMDFVSYKKDNIDIHHVFPKKYCESQNYDKKLWNSVVNKTPISYDTNRKIGGIAPSKYLAKIEKDGNVQPQRLDSYLESHLLDVASMRNDDFKNHIIIRARNLLNAIEKVTGKKILGRDSQDVIKEFGGTL